MLHSFNDMHHQDLWNHTLLMFVRYEKEIELTVHAKGSSGHVYLIFLNPYKASCVNMAILLTWGEWNHTDMKTSHL